MVTPRIILESVVESTANGTGKKRFQQKNLLIKKNKGMNTWIKSYVHSKEVFQNKQLSNI